MRTLMAFLTCLVLALLLFPGLAAAAGPAGALPVSVLDTRLPVSVVDVCLCEPGSCTCEHCIGQCAACPCAVAKKLPAVTLHNYLPTSVLAEKPPADVTTRFPTPTNAEQRYWLANGGWRWSFADGGYWYRYQQQARVTLTPVYNPQYVPVQPRYFGSIRNIMPRFGGGMSCSGGG